MPRIFDNIDERLLPALQQTLTTAVRADFSVGYFNLRGWKQIAAAFDDWPGGAGHCCRLLVGMQRPPRDELRAALRFSEERGIDNQSVKMTRVGGPEWGKYGRDCTRDQRCKERTEVHRSE